MSEGCDERGRPSALLSAAVLLALVGMVAVGCGDGATQQSDAPLPADPAETPLLAGDVVLEPIDGDGLAEALARHRGKVVLVDFWATWCAPCVELFPHTVTLHRRLADRGLVVVSVSMDEPEDADAVRAFLARHRATFENYLSRYGVGSAAFEAFDLDAVPHLKLYDRDGNLHRTFSGAEPGHDPSQIDRAIEELL